MSDDEIAAANDWVVLIVAYRSAGKLENCLRAVQKHLPGRDVYVGTIALMHPDVLLLAERFNHVQWLTNSQNIGFAAAVNQLAALVPGRDMLLLNPDAELLERSNPRKQPCGSREWLPQHQWWMAITYTAPPVCFWTNRCSGTSHTARSR